MANEAILMVETHLPIQFTVADGVGIEKGAILKMTDPMTAAISDGDGDIIAGIAAAEKIANDGNTTLAVYRGGVFKVLAGAAITIGVALDTHSATGAANEVAPIAVNGENVLGIALEAASDTHTLLMELRPTVMNLA